MLYFTTSTASITLSVWRIEESIDELLSYLPLKLRETYKSETERRFSHSSRILEWLAVRVLFHKTEGEEKRIAYNPDGSPYVVTNQGEERLFISISHTRGFAAIAISRTQKIGIDIEALGTRIEKIVHRFSFETEKPIDCRSVDEWRKYYTVVWSAKESVFKSCGKSATDVVTNITLTPFHLETKGQVIATAPCAEKVVTYQLFPAFALTYTD